MHKNFFSILFKIIKNVIKITTNVGVRQGAVSLKLFNIKNIKQGNEKIILNANGILMIPNVVYAS